MGVFCILSGNGTSVQKSNASRALTGPSKTKDEYTNQMCNGSNQSPIDIDTSLMEHRFVDDFEWVNYDGDDEVKTSKFTLLNNGRGGKSCGASSSRIKYHFKAGHVVFVLTH